MTGRALSLHPQRIARLRDGIVATFGLFTVNESNGGRSRQEKSARARTTNLVIIRELAEAFGWPTVLLPGFPEATAVTTNAKRKRKPTNKAFDLRPFALAPGARHHDFAPPLRIRITRLAPRLFAVTETDSLASALKATQDGVSRWLGIDDGDPRLMWERCQSKSPSYGVMVEIERVK